MPAFCPHACIRFCEAVVSTCRSLACLSRCTRTVGLTAGAEWLCHGCVYACLSLALRCAYIYASGLHRAVVLTNRHCYAWLGCCWLLRWLADCLDVKRDLQARFCDRPDAIVVCTRQAGMNTKRTWASRVLACIIDRRLEWFLSSFFARVLLIARLIFSLVHYRVRHRACRLL